MRTCLLALTVFAFLVPLVSLGQEKTENPYKTAKVGDYVTYKATTAFGGKDIEITMKQIVTAQDDKEVAVKITSIFMGQELPAQTTKIDLNKPFDITSAGLLAKNQGKFEKTGEGKEKIKVGDTTYECHWISGKVVADLKGKKIESDVKIWTSKSVPLSGMVKMETKATFANVKLELSGSGSEK